MTCSEALVQWKKGFATFAGKYPAQFKQGGESYTDPNAVALVSLFNEAEQPVYCGTPKGCDDGILLCYIKPSPFQELQYPVTAGMWHKVEESFNLKPKVEAHNNGNQEFLNAVNAVRDAEGLKLEKFTAASDGKGLKSKSTSTPYQDALYNVTCAQIEASSIDPKVEDKYTLIYAVKDGKQPPTAIEAVDIWKTGYAKLGPDAPPAFNAKGMEVRAAATGSEIYYDNTVAGFVSLMVDGTREIRCYNATGCKKAALICFLSKPTLVEDTPPISDDTWKKILALDNQENGESANESIKFTIRTEADNCLTEINEFRTQDSLDLSTFVAKVQTSTGATPEEAAKTESVELAKAVTCDALKTGNAPILFSSNKRSLMYFSGSSATCSNAVTEWKKGYEKFKDFTSPPTYTSSETVYQTRAATNFISLVSEGEDTVARCYTVENCTEAGLVCVLEPAVFEDGTAPITEATWQKITKALSNGVRAASVYGALPKASCCWTLVIECGTRVPTNPFH